MSESMDTPRKSWAGIVRPAGGTDAPAPAAVVLEDVPPSPAAKSQDDTYRAWHVDPLKDRQYMLELRYRDPTTHVQVVDVFPYALLTHVRLMAGTVMTLDFSGTVVMIEGRELGQLIAPLKQSTVTSIEAWSRLHHQEPDVSDPKVVGINFIEPVSARSKPDETRMRA